jgi:hypothetical protein
MKRPEAIFGPEHVVGTATALSRQRRRGALANKLARMAWFWLMTAGRRITYARNALTFHLHLGCIWTCDVVEFALFPRGWFVGDVGA